MHNKNCANIEMEENLNFEESMQKLETIANELEKGNLSLDESVNKFEEGMEVSKQCSKRLDDAEKRISILLKQGEELVEENFLPDNND